VRMHGNFLAVGALLDDYILFLIFHRLVRVLGIFTRGSGAPAAIADAPTSML
jgi:hypothetical protein